MFNFFKKQIKESTSGFCQTELPTYSEISGYNNMVKMFIKYYYECAPVGIAVDLIADSIADLPISAKKLSDDEFVYNADIIKKLKKPNKDESINEFLRKLTACYLLTGNVFIDFNKIGSSYEMIILKPQNITFSGNNIYGKASQILYSNSIDNVSIYREYNYNQDNNNYISQQGTLLLHLKDTNLSTIDSQLGISRLVKAQLEIAQYHNSSIHNNSVIKNNCRPSLAFFFEGDDMSESQIEAVQNTMRQVSGNSNSGKPIAITGKCRIERLSESVKDMDFESLQKNKANAIYSSLKIPLPLINQDSMTYSNYKESSISFYNNVVLQLAEVIISFYNNQVLPLLNENRHILAIDKASIPALENMKLELATNYAKTGCFTVNEIRNILGFEATTGGDILYQPQNLIPVGSDKYIQDNRDTPSEKSFFITLLQEQGYSKQEIDNLVKKYY